MFEHEQIGNSKVKIVQQRKHLYFSNVKYKQSSINIVTANLSNLYVLTVQFRSYKTQVFKEYLNWYYCKK